MRSRKHLKAWLIVLLVGGSLGLSSPIRAAEGYTLVLKDGRRIEITAYEEAGAWLYYYRYDARIGIPRDKIEAIVASTPRTTAVPLDDEILGRIAREHKRRFRLQDFLRADYVEAEITPLMSPAEQLAYVRKLLQLKKREIFEIDDRRQDAEEQGDMVELAQLEVKMVRLLADWIEGREALTRLTRGQMPVGWQADDHPTPPDEEVANASDEAPEGAGASAVDADALTGLEKLYYRREMLRLVLKKHYQVDSFTGGFHSRRQAEEELRIVSLQILFFDRLPPPTPPASPPAPPGPEEPETTPAP